MIPQSQISHHEEKHWVISEHCSQHLTNSKFEKCLDFMIESMLSAGLLSTYTFLTSFAAAVRTSQELHIWIASEQASKSRYSRGRLDNTGEWFLALESYRTWRIAEGSSLLWLHGLAGTGKSTLCSVLVDNLRGRGKEEDLVIYCFLEDAPGSSDWAAHILRAITYQLREHRHCLVPDLLIRSILKTVEDHTFGVTSAFFRRSLRDIFRAIDSQAQISLVLDGFESVDWISSVVVDEINRANLWRKGSKRLRCAISTRSPFQTAFQKSDCFEINLSKEHAVLDDLKAFVGARLVEPSSATARLDAPSRESLVGKLCSQSNGSFIWVALAAETLQQVETPGSLPKVIGTLSPTDGGFYGLELGDIPASDVGITQSLFSWLIVATRPLHFTELLEALTVAIDGRQFPVCAKPPVTKGTTPLTVEDIVRICRGLVIVTEEGYVKFRHPSVRRHILHKTGMYSAEHALLQAHEHVAETCLVLLNSRQKMTYLLFCINSSLANSKDQGQRSSLLDYAATNWSYHYRLAENHSKILAGTLQRCISMTLDYACEFFSISRKSRSVQIATTTLRICAYYGFATLTQICLEMGIKPNNGACHYCETPIAIATAAGHAPIATLLLRKTPYATPDTCYKNEGIMHHTAAHGFLEVIKLILARGGDANAIDQRSGRRPLHNAAAFGHLELVKMLMEYGVDVNAVIPDTHETPLHLAALHGHTTVVKYLVDGRDASSKEIELYDRIVEQPYFQAWMEKLFDLDIEFGEYSHETRSSATEESIQELLSCSTRYTNINLETRNGWTAVHLAASKGHEAIVGFLLERGATLKVTGNTTCTALQIAAEYGQLATVKLLLAAGADLKGGTESIGSILGRVQANGHRSIARLLVWHAFVSQVHGSVRNWSLLSLATKSKHATAHDMIHRKRHQKKLTTRTLRSRQPLKTRDGQHFLVTATSRKY